MPEYGVEEAAIIVVVEDQITDVDVRLLQHVVSQVRLLALLLLHTLHLALLLLTQRP
jgi:hypothetical protein